MDPSLSSLSREARREICRHCLLPRLNCYCAALAPQVSVVRWIFLQHPREARNPIGTARMAHLSLPGSHLLCGVDFSNDARLRKIIADAERPAMLFPATGARPLEELASETSAPTLIVLDGTWSQAKKLWKLNTFLHDLPAYRLEPRQPSRYRIRSEPAAHCVSTIEAVEAALQTLDPDGDHRAREAMLLPFLNLVNRQVHFGERPTRSPRRRVRTPRHRHLPPPLQRDREAALLIHVESNGFPKHLKERPPTELVQLCAHRLRDDTSFEAIARPLHQGPCFHELGLSQEDEASAVPIERLKAHWQAFEHPNDVWVSWGQFPMDLMRRAGIDVHEGIDLRHWCSSFLGRNPGTLENACLLLGLNEAPAHLTQRAANRLCRLAQVFRCLLSETEDGVTDG